MKKTQKTVPLSAKALTIMLSPMLAGPVAAGSTIICGTKQPDFPMAGQTTVVISTNAALGFTSIGSFSTELPSTGAVFSVTGSDLGSHGTNVADCFNQAGVEKNFQCTIVFVTDPQMPNAFFGDITDDTPTTMTCSYTALPVELETFEIE